MDNLKPCPFCGGEVHIVGGPEDWAPTAADPDSGEDPIAVLCKGCECGMYYFDDYGDAIAAWNRRPPARMYEFEELESKEGCPVWFVSLIDPSDSEWRIIEEYWSDGAGGDVKFGSGHIEYDDDYGKTWLAYDRPPGEEEVTNNAK